jgi:hypothetical protein
MLWANAAEEAQINRHRTADTCLILLKLIEVACISFYLLPSVVEKTKTSPDSAKKRDQPLERLISNIGRDVL